MPSVPPNWSFQCLALIHLRHQRVEDVDHKVVVLVRHHIVIRGYQLVTGDVPNESSLDGRNGGLAGQENKCSESWLGMVKRQPRTEVNRSVLDVRCTQGREIPNGRLNN